jgi:hypothetical protein
MPLSNTLNFALCADRRFVLRTIAIADAASDAQDDRESCLLPEWESPRDCLDRLGSRIKSALESLGLEVKVFNRGADNDEDEVARPMTVLLYDQHDHEIVIDLSRDGGDWSITEVHVVL